MRLIHSFMLIGLLCSVSRAEDITVELAPGQKVTSAIATASAMKLTAQGKIDGATIHFTKLLPTTGYDLTFTLADGTTLQGVDMGWRNGESFDAKADPMNDEDRAAVTDLVKPDKDFFNKLEIIAMAGNHNQVTALVKQIRDRAFHSDTGGEIISRFELWYFKFEYGGWEKVQQGSKLLRRDRFESQDAFEKTIGTIKWLPELGGIKLEKGKDRTIKLTSASAPGPTQQSPTPPNPADTSPVFSNPTPASTTQPAP